MTLYGLAVFLISLALLEAATIPTVDWFQQGQDTLNDVLNRPHNEDVAKNVIMFLGDGMGVSTVTAARILKGQQAGRPGEEGQLTFETFPSVGLSKTYNVNYQVPDSAGTATAFLCGVKAQAGVLGVNQNTQRRQCDTVTGNEVSSILEWSHQQGKSTGIVTTTRITHATPAAAYAHTAERNWEADSNMPEADRAACPDVARQLIDDHGYIKVLMGGGRARFLPSDTPDPEYGNDLPGIRADGRNLMEDWAANRRSNGEKFAMFWNQSGFDAADPNEDDYMLGLFEPSHMQYELHRQEDKAGEPSIADMTEKAIRVLRKNPNGFFLLVEGGQIDLAHHKLLAKASLTEVIAFDAAVQRAMTLVPTGETLVVVTADHSHGFTITGYPRRGQPILGEVGTDPTRDLYYIPALDGEPFLTLGYANGPGPIRENLTDVDTEADDYVFPVRLPTKEETHAGEDVAVYASGPMSHLFVGAYEQNYIAHAMSYASCVGENRRHCERENTGGAANNLQNIFLLVISMLAVITLS